MLRILCGFLVLLAGSLALGQGDVPFSTPPQVFVTVQPQEVGAEIVTVTVRDENYDPALLQLQCTLMGKFAGTEARGIQVSETNLGSSGGAKLLRAKFACPGLVDAQAGRLNIDAIVKAFLGSAQPMITSFLIQFDGLTAGPNTIRRIVNDTFLLEGKSLRNPTGLEYRVEVLTQDTRALKIPQSLSEVPASEKNRMENKLHPLVIPSLVVGLLAAGALVYFAVLRPRPASRSK